MQVTDNVCLSPNVATEAILITGQGLEWGWGAGGRTLPRRKIWIQYPEVGVDVGK